MKKKIAKILLPAIIGLLSASVGVGASVPLANHSSLIFHNENNQWGNWLHYINHSQSSFPLNQFAMPKISSPGHYAAGSVYPAKIQGDQVILYINQNSTVTTSIHNVHILTVPLGSKSHPVLFHNKLILGFADGSNSQYLQNVLTDPLSVFSPLSYQLADSSGNLSGSLSASVIQKAHQMHVQMWPIIASGFNPALTTRFLSNPEAKFNLLEKVIQIAKNGNVDGINFDFEDMIPADAIRYTEWIASASTVLHAMGKWVSVDVTIPSNDPHWGLVYQRAPLAKSADYLVEMSYDQHYQGEQTIGSVSSLPWMKQGTNALTRQGVPKTKILLGIPFYILDWYKSNGQWNSSYLTMNTMQNAKKIPGAHMRFDPLSGQDILTYNQGGFSHYVWMENALSLSERASYIRSDQLAGAAIWQLELGSKSNIATLIRSF